MTYISLSEGGAQHLRERKKIEKQIFGKEKDACLAIVVNQRGRIDRTTYLISQASKTAPFNRLCNINISPFFRRAQIARCNPDTILLPRALYGDDCRGRLTQTWSFVGAVER